MHGETVKIHILFSLLSELQQLDNVCRVVICCMMSCIAARENGSQLFDLMYMSV
jgi:hypothetical protein